MARYYQKPEDQIILEEIKAVIAIRPTYGYRRVTTMVNRKRSNEGRNKINRKRVQRIMQMNGLSLPQAMPDQKREHTGVIMTMFPNIRWCSDGMEIRCFNGDKVFVAFALDCCDREAFAYVARAEPLSADDIEELMVKAVEKRFGASLRAPREVQWLSDRGSIYRAKSVKTLARHLNLQCCYTRAYSPESNGMAEAFVKTIKRDYVYQADCDSAETVLKLLPEWFADYNHVAPHSALGMKSPVEYKESVNL
ncbi:integrase catalytic region [Bdellovibrio bacteriovorus W]|nr:integrase catalytic region [Bdellovibrio bacteriovorus W]